MSDEELKKWSNETFRELKELEYKKCRILDRCCRAAMNGAVELREYDDPVLMKTYTLKLRFCPECGRELDFDIE
jgi:hypothetical protein